MFKKIMSRVFLWVVLIALYIPILLLVIYSFSETRTVRLDNFQFGFDLYAKMFQNKDIGAAIANTLLIAVISGVIATLMGTIASFGVMAMKKRVRGAIMSVNQIPVVNADIVTGFALMLLFVALGSTSGYVNLIFAHVLIGLPFIVLTVLPRIQQLDGNVFEAGQDLGATPFQSLFKVIIPQLIPAMVSAFFLGFTLSLDDFIITQYNNEGIKTISTIVYGATKKTVPPEFRALSACIFFLVIVILVVNILRTRKQTKKGGLKK